MTAAAPTDPEAPNPPGWDTLEYRGYRGTVLFDEAADAFYGHVANLRRDGVTFVGRTTEELRKALRDSIEFYLECCAADGREPEPPGAGPCGEPYLTHLPYEACRRIEKAAHAAGQSVGEWIADRAAEAVASESESTTADPVRAAA